METLSFIKKIQNKSPRELRNLRNHYISKRQSGDHTYKTLTRIKLLTNILLVKGK